MRAPRPFLRLTWQQKVLSVGLLPALLLGGALLVGQRLMVGSQEAARWVSHTQDVIATAEETYSDVLAAVAGERGFVIAGDEAFLRPYERALRSFAARVARLRVLVADNPPQLARVARIEQLFEEWVAKVASHVIETRRRTPVRLAGEAHAVLSEILRLQQAVAPSSGAKPSANDEFAAIHGRLEALGGDEAIQRLAESLKSALGERVRDEAKLERLAVELTTAARRAEDELGRLIGTGAGQALIDSLRSAVGELTAEEQRLLGLRQGRNVTMATLARTVTFGSGLLAVLLGLALATRLARQVGRTLASVDDAARALARGDAKVRASVPGDDTLAAVARSFNAMAETLERRQREEVMLARLGEFLMSAEDAAEAATIVSSVLADLLSGTRGALFVAAASRNLVRAAASWGEHGDDLHPFHPEECWALRRGRVHDGLESSGALSCRHVPAGERDYLCVPLVAQGEALSIIHVRPFGVPDRAALLALVASVGERAAVALANLRLKETLKAQSIRDPLTGLYNRRYLQETLGRELARVQREGIGLGVVVADVDHFKRFNDTHGHQAGDAVLREVGQALGAGLRREDIACRYGGEEFVLVLPGANLEQTTERAEALRTLVRGLRVTHGDTALGAITASFGVSAYAGNGADADALIRAADEALYRAKREGRDRVVAASPLGPRALPVAASGE